MGPPSAGYIVHAFNRPSGDVLILLARYVAGVLGVIDSIVLAGVSAVDGIWLKVVEGAGDQNVQVFYRVAGAGVFTLWHNTTQAGVDLGVPLFGIGVDNGQPAPTGGEDTIVQNWLGSNDGTLVVPV
jgi:hypothetical protein